MARRASSQPALLWPLLLFLLFAAAVGGGYALYQRLGDPYRTLQPLDVASYLENANSLRGNVYKIEGVIQNALAWSPQKGRLISIEVGSRGGNDVLPVIVPSDFNHINIQKGQRFYFKVEIGKDGAIFTRDLSKS